MPRRLPFLILCYLLGCERSNSGELDAHLADAAYEEARRADGSVDAGPLEDAQVDASVEDAGEDGGTPTEDAGGACRAEHRATALGPPVELFDMFARNDITGVASMPDGGYALIGYATETLTLGDVTLEPVGDKDVFLARFSREDDVVFAHRWETPWLLSVPRIASTSDGHIVLAGPSAGPTSLDETGAERRPILVSYSADGSVAWSRSYSSCGFSGLNVVGDLIFVVGACNDEASLGDGVSTGMGPLLASFDSEGRARFAWDNEGRPAGVINDIAVASTGQIVTIGNNHSFVDFGGGAVEARIVTLRFAADGALEDYRSFGAPALAVREGLAVAVDSCDRVYLAGAGDSELDFGDGTTDAADDGFIAVFELDYSFLFAHRFEPLASEHPEHGASRALFFDLVGVEGGVIAAGGSESSIEIGGALIAFDELDLQRTFVAYVGGDGSVGPAEAFARRWRLGSSLHLAGGSSGIVGAGDRYVRRLSWSP